MTTPPSGPAALAGAVALVTGGAQGIGRAIALALADVGADVAILDLQPAPDTVMAIQTRGRRALSIVGNVAEREVAAAAVARVLKELGRLDIVVNNAGISERVGLEDLDEKTFNRTLDVTLKGTVVVTQAAYPHLKRDGGAIVNVASTSAMAGGTISFRADHEDEGGRSGPAYAAAKAGVIGASKSLALELAKRNVTVNEIGRAHV